MWNILYNPENGIYTLSDKDHLIFYKNDILVQELDEGLSEEEARKFYIEFLDLIFPVNNSK